MRPRNIAITTVAFAASLGAQAPAHLSLGPASGRLSEEFTMISSARELADGRVLVVDDRDKRLGVADFSAGTFTMIGRQGRGPGEYTQVTRLWPLGGDSTLVADLFAQRWLLLVGDRIVTTIAGDNAAIRATRGWLYGADRHGFVIGNAPGARPMEDSMFAIRINRTTGIVDTLARLGRGERGPAAGAAGAARAAGGAASGPRRFMMSLATQDYATLFADGWVGVARVSPYRVDWCSPEGRCTRGQPLSGSGNAMTDADRRAYMTYSRKVANWPRTDNLDETAGWPSVVPPFSSNPGLIDGTPTLPLGDGRLVIHRTPSARMPKNSYDIIDRAGHLAAQLTLETNQRIVGFGARSAYLVVIDDDGIQRLTRHPWP